MKLGGLGWPELLIILVVVLLIFGPKNLPKLGSALGKTVKGLRDGMGAGKKKVREAADKVVADNDENVEDAEVLEEVVEDEPEKAAPAAAKPKQVKKVVVKKA